jgi:hypothetical protein
MATIHVNYASKFLKWKHKTTFIELIHRFYSPTVFLVMGLSAFNAITYTQYIGILLIIISFFSSIMVSWFSWERWKKDFMYLAESEREIPKSTTYFIVFCEFVVQFLVSIASFWWISQIPEQVFLWTGLERYTQAILWSVLLLFIFVLHIVLWKKSSKEMERLLTTTYQHLGRDIP